MLWSFGTIGFNTFIWEQSCAQPGARRRERCCNCHYSSWTDSIKPSLLFSNCGCCISKGSPFRLFKSHIPNNLLPSDPRRCFCCGLFRHCSSASWSSSTSCSFCLWLSGGPSVELFSWRSACAYLFYAVLIVCVPFLFGVWGRMWKIKR